MSTPQEKPKTKPRTATTVQKELWAFQNDAPKTPGSAMGNAGCIVAMGVFVWIIYFGLKFFGFSIENFFKDAGALMGLVGILILLLATLSPVIGVILFLIAMVRPKRSLRCPFCMADHSLYKPVRSYVCTECAAVLRIPANTSSGELVKIACPLCHTSWAAPANAGEMNCFSCGLSLEVHEGEARTSGRPINCWSCNAEIREGVYFCHHCGCLVTEPQELPPYRVHTDLHEMVFKTLPPTTADGMDAISLRANSPIGFLVRGLWRVQATANQLLAETEPEKKLTLAEQCDHLRAMDEAVDYLNETVTLDPKLTPAVHRALSSYDACMSEFCGRIEEKNDSSDFTVKAAYKELLKNLPQKHNALLKHPDETPEMKPGEARPKKWPQPLFALKESGNILSVRDVPAFHSWRSRLTTLAQVEKIRVPEEALDSIAKPLA